MTDTSEILFYNIYIEASSGNATSSYNEPAM